MTNRTVLSDIANIAHVKRWHALNVHREQTVAEHTVLVTFYAHRLLTVIYPGHTPEEAMSLILNALWHDVAEAVTGDVPTPVKRWMEARFPDGESPLDDLEHMVCPEHARYSEAVEDTPMEAISKLADILEAQHFIMIEGKDYRGEDVFKGRGKAFDDLVARSKERWPQLRWDQAYQVREELLYGRGVQIEFRERFQPELAREA